MSYKTNNSEKENIGIRTWLGCSNPDNKVPFTLQHIVAVLFSIAMFLVFPLYLTNQYYNARGDKYFLFIALTVIAFVCVVMFMLSDYFSRTNRNLRQDIFKLFKGFNCVDVLVLSFLAVNIISAVLATVEGGNFSTYFNGDLGRNMGIFTHLMLTVAYFIVSRLFYLQRYIFTLFLLGMAIMSVLAVLNYYNIDPLNIYEGHNVSTIAKFISTIGNKNMLSAMICVSLPFSVGMAICSDHKVTRILSYVSVGIQFLGLIVATSDGGFLGCFFGLFILFIYACRNIRRLGRFFMCCAIMLDSVQFLWLFDLLMKSNNKGYSSFSKFFLYNRYLWIFAQVFIVLAVVCVWLEKNKRVNIQLIQKILFIVSIVLLALIIVFSAIMFAYFSNTANYEKYKNNEFISFFHFDEEWGTHRGFFWLKSFQIFDDFDFRQTMFGNGPDSYVEVFSVYDEELSERYGESTSTAAHSVYINYLVTYGIWGFAIYLLFIIAAIVTGAKLAVNNPLALICFGAIVAYAVQDIVNIANPINTPWLFMMIAICQSARTEQNSVENVLPLM